MIALAALGLMVAGAPSASELVSASFNDADRAYRSCLESQVRAGPSLTNGRALAKRTLSACAAVAKKRDQLLSQFAQFGPVEATWSYFYTQYIHDVAEAIARCHRDRKPERVCGAE